MVIVILGSGAHQITFDRVIEWEEVKSSRVPRKLNVGNWELIEIVETPAVIVSPRTFNLTTRLTSSQKTNLMYLQREHIWQPLTDDGVTINQVWIESVKARWAIVEDKRRPWLTEIGLVASNV